MMLLVQSDESISWLAPYAFGVVVFGFLFFLFRVFENWFAANYDKPLYRNIFVYKKLTSSQLKIVEEELDFYQILSASEKKQFQHRVSSFLAEKNFVSRDNFQITERVTVLIAAVGCMLSFGRKNYNYALIDYILVYPNEFYSEVNDNYHKGEFNPREKALVLSWKDFEEGYQITNDNRNLGVHEFMHAMQLEARRGSDIDSNRLKKQFQNILKRLSHQEVKDQLDATRFFREYAFTNQFEFLAVLAEYFLESPEELKKNFPQIYGYTRKMLNFGFGPY